MKKIFMTMLSLSLCVVISAGAVSLPASNVNLSDAKDIDSIFDQTKGLQIIDAEGNNITETFVDNHINDYSNGAYQKIINDLGSQSLSVITPRMMLDKFAVSYNVKTYMINHLTGQQTAEWASFDIYGHYRVYDYNGTIESGGPISFANYKTSNAGIIPTVYEVGSSSCQISADKKTIYFNVNWHVDFNAKYGGALLGYRNGNTVFKGIA